MKSFVVNIEHVVDNKNEIFKWTCIASHIYILVIFRDVCIHYIKYPFYVQTKRIYSTNYRREKKM